MPLPIPKKIADDEILVHYIFDRNFKKKVIAEEKLVSKDIFLPNKGGVSLQRNSYCDENKCKMFAKGVAIGYGVFGFSLSGAVLVGKDAAIGGSTGFGAVVG